MTNIAFGRFERMTVDRFAWIYVNQSYIETPINFYQDYAVRAGLTIPAGFVLSYLDEIEEKHKLFFGLGPDYIKKTYIPVIFLQFDEDLSTEEIHKWEPVLSLARSVGNHVKNYFRRRI